MGNCILTNRDVLTTMHSGIYGIKRNVSSSSPQWERTLDSIGLQAGASVPCNPYVIGYSDFDKIAPWSGIKRETLSTGDIMVKIPKFYYRRYKTNNDESIEITTLQGVEGFNVHPAFTHNGREQDYIYVGAYKTSGSENAQTSLPGRSPLVNITRAAFRGTSSSTGAKAKGSGWGIIDITTVSAIQMLYLVEYANNNAQYCIGSGNSSTSAAINTGRADGVPKLVGRETGTDTSVAVVYRGIENFWGDVWEFTDGLNFNNGQYLICNNQLNYADDTATGYTALSYTGATNWYDTFISKLGIDSNNSWCMMPSEASGGSSTTYYCDAIWSSTGWRVFIRGGCWGDGASCGAFAAIVYYASSDASTALGSRLLYIPA